MEGSGKDGDLIAEIRAAFDAYEAALMANDVEALIAFFWRDDRAVRLSPGASLYGFEAIVGFRKDRDASDVARDLTKVEILPLGADCGVVSAEYRRRSNGRLGAQSQVWKKLPEGWRIVAAHVSLAPI